MGEAHNMAIKAEMTYKRSSNATPIRRNFVDSSNPSLDKGKSVQTTTSTSDFSPKQLVQQKSQSKGASNVAKRFVPNNQNPYT